MATRWEQSGYQGHDAPSLDPPRPDITQYNNAYTLLRQLEHKLAAAHSDLQHISTRLASWTRAQLDHAQAFESLEAAMRGRSKLVAFFRYRKDRSHVKALRTQCDALVVDDLDRRILEEHDSELQLLLKGFERALSEWHESIDNSVIWQGYASWQRRRAEARTSSAELRQTLLRSSEGYSSWQSHFNSWLEGFRNAVEIHNEDADGRAT